MNGSAPHDEWIYRLSRQVGAPGWIERITHQLEEPARQPHARPHPRPRRLASDATVAPPRAPRRPARLYGEPPLRLQVRLPPRRTVRLRTGRSPGDSRVGDLPQEHDLRTLLGAVGRHDARMAALVALLAFTGRPLTDLLRMTPTDLQDVQLPNWAWPAVLRLLRERRRRGVHLSGLLLSTFRNGMGNPLDDRDVVRMLHRHQLRRGYWPPFTVTALRVRPWRLTGRIVSLDTILTDGGRRCESMRKLGALDGVVGWNTRA